jgi:hypothetical protein
MPFVHADRQSGDLQARVIEERKVGQNRGVKDTPTLFVNGSEVRSGFRG